MFLWLIVAAVIGCVVGSVTSITLLGVIVGGALFCIGLPFALIGEFVYGITSEVQDRNDYRQMMSDLEADRRMEESEHRKDERAEQYLTKRRLTKQIYNDYRQINLTEVRNGG